jgi:integrase
MARGFLAYLRAMIPDTEVPDSGLVAAFRRPKPYLLTPPQITALIQGAQPVGPRGSLRPSTFSTVIGLLASTGLRIGEAIRLTTGDVHLDHTPPVLHIRETKFHKSRYVPLHPTTAAQLRRYLARRTALRYDAFSDVFFVSEPGQALTHRALGS